MYPHCIRSLLALLALLACSAVHAAIPTFEGYAVASDEELDKMRGGFEFNFNGMQLMLAFSLERLTYINGELVSSMKLNPLQFISATSGQGSAVATAPSPGTVVTTQLVNNQGIINLVQNGAGNAFALPQSLSSLNTVIQNTVNDQVIRNLTVLNATLSLRSAAAAMQMGAALNQAIAASLR